MKALNSSLSRHVAVLTTEVMESLDVKPGGRYLDATLGGGTHTRELLRRSAPDGRVLALDLDTDAIRRTRHLEQKSCEDGRLKLVEGNFRHLDQIAQREGFIPLDGILIDLGLSSDQLAHPRKGFSFQAEGPLDMRFGNAGITAAEIINTWREDEIADVLLEYGEERYARKIARAIVSARKRSPIVTTTQLVDLVKTVVPPSYERGRIHPATRTFQALRIAVNDELGVLRDAMVAAARILGAGGRLAIISFHSLEDRIVKTTFKTSSHWRPLTKKPTVPTKDEIKNNPRARSAKLRAALRN